MHVIWPQLQKHEWLIPGHRQILIKWFPGSVFSTERSLRFLKRMAGPGRPLLLVHSGWFCSNQTSLSSHCLSPGLSHTGTNYKRSNPKITPKRFFFKNWGGTQDRAVSQMTDLGSLCHTKNKTESTGALQCESLSGLLLLLTRQVGQLF